MSNSLTNLVYMCEVCGKVRVSMLGTRCGGCNYRTMVEFMKHIDPDDQDWPFGVCEECASALGDQGECRNTRCGNSPYEGLGWE